MVVGFTTARAIIGYHHSKVVRSNPFHGEVYKRTYRLSRETSSEKVLVKLKLPPVSLYNPNDLDSSTRLGDIISILVPMDSWLEIFLTPSDEDKL
jgi:hypothetical protein